jgi:hypothetical protein
LKAIQGALCLYHGVLSRLNLVNDLQAHFGFFLTCALQPERQGLQLQMQLVCVESGWATRRQPCLRVFTEFRPSYPSQESARCAVYPKRARRKCHDGFVTSWAPSAVTCVFTKRLVLFAAKSSAARTVSKLTVFRLLLFATADCWWRGPVDPSPPSTTPAAYLLEVRLPW